MSGAAPDGHGAARPFPGLRPFEYADREFFFGRNNQVYALYRMLDRSRFVAVVGSSGSGKSSLIFAGLRPLLEKDSSQPGGQQWIWQQMSPKNAPIAGLIDLVHRLTFEHGSAEVDPSFRDAQRNRIAYLIRLSSRGLVDALAEIEALRDKTLVLVVDQFEELFRYARPTQSQRRPKQSAQREEAVLFVQLLLAASFDPDCRVKIVLTMRSDFIGDCANFRGLPEAVSESQYLVPGLTREQLEEVIRKPLEKSGASIDSRLVERLLNDVSDEPDQLPVLQHCLLRLWQAAVKAEASGEVADVPETGGDHGHPHITIRHYDAIDRVAGALSKHADDVLSGLPALEPVVERVFRALSEIDKEGRATRRTVTFSQLLAETGAPEVQLCDVLDRFRADDCSFLRPTFSDAPRLEADQPLDVGHEALLRRWDRVRGNPEATGAASDPRPVGWLREEEEDSRHYQALLYQDELPLSQVRRTAQWWNKLPRTPAWADRYGGGYDRVAQLLKRGQEALKAEQTRQRNLARLKIGSVSLVCLLLAISVGLLVLFAKERQVAEANAAAAQASAKAAQANLGAVLSMGNKVYSSTLNNLNRGDLSTAAAQTMAALAGEAIKSMLAAYPDNPEVQAVIAKQLLTVSDIYITIGNNESAYQDAMNARELTEQLLKADANNQTALNLKFGALFRIGDVLVASGPHMDVKQGLALYQQAQSLAAQLASKSPQDGDRLYSLAFIHNKVGETYQQLADQHQDPHGLSEAMIEFNNGLQVASRVAAFPGAKIEWLAYPAATLTKIGRLLVDSGRVAEGIEKYDQAIALQTGILTGASENNDIVSSNLLTTHRLKGSALLQQAKTSDAASAPAKYALAFAEYQAALGIAGHLVDKDAGNATWLVATAVACNQYAQAEEAFGDKQAALQLYGRELDARQKLVTKDKTNEVWQRGFSRAQAKISQLQAQMPNGASTAQAAPGSLPSPSPK